MLQRAHGRESKAHGLRATQKCHVQALQAILNDLDVKSIAIVG